MILIMGIAGSGKGTQGKLLADGHGYHLISMGDVLRKLATEKQRERMQSGELLDDKEIIAIVDQFLSELPDEPEVLLDGFPRTIPQAEWLVDQAKKDRFKLTTAFHLVASKEAVKQRLIGRARADDVDGAIEQRFAEYEKATAPILEWLRGHDVDVYDVNGERSVEEVQQDLVNHLK